MEPKHPRMVIEDFDLEHIFRPSSYSSKTRWSDVPLVIMHQDMLDVPREYPKMEDISDEFRKKLEGLPRLPPHPADAGERDAGEYILGQEPRKPYDTQPVHDGAPVSSYNFTSIDDLTVARAASDAIRKHYLSSMSVTGATFASLYASALKKDCENAFTMDKNVQAILVDYLVPQQGQFNDFYKQPNKLFQKHNKDISVTPAEERVKLLLSDTLLSVVNDSVPKDPNRGRFRCPIYFDSGATVHVVGDVWMLQGYQVLAEPWPIAVADGHPLVVVGIGSISQEGFMIPNVFHVQGLKMNLISVSQLDRGHGLFSGFHDGMCKVLKRGGDVVGGGFLLANGLYALSFLEVPETETLQVPETETGEEAGSAIQAM